MTRTPVTRFVLNGAPAIAFDGITVQFPSSYGMNAAARRFAEFIEQGAEGPLPSTGSITVLAGTLGATEDAEVRERFVRGKHAMLSLQAYGSQGVRAFMRVRGKRRYASTWEQVIDIIADDMPEFAAAVEQGAKSVVAECAERAECRPYDLDGFLTNPGWQFNCGFMDAHQDIDKGRRPRTLDHAGDGLGPLPASNPAYVGGYRAAWKVIKPGTRRIEAHRACGVARFVFMEAEMPEFAAALTA